jgi:hypothetical protein
MGAVYTGQRFVCLCGGNHRPENRGGCTVPAAPREEGLVLKEGDKSPAVIGTSYDGATFDLGVPGRRTVLWFYPKANTGG